MKLVFSSIVFFLACFTLGAQCNPGGGGGTPSITGGGVANIGEGGSTGISINSSFGQQFLTEAFNGTYSESSELAYQKIKGSPYLNDDLVKGVLVFNDGSVMKDVPLRIDLYTDEFIATNIDGDEIVLDTRFFLKIMVPHDGQDVVYKKVNPNKPEQFYEVLYEDGDMAFFKERFVTLREGTNNGMSKTDSKFRQRTNYFIRHDDQQVAKVRLKKKDIFSGFVDSELYAMKAYAKRKGIKFKDEKDYVAVFTAINE